MDTHAHLGVSINGGSPRMVAHFFMANPQLEMDDNEGAQPNFLRKRPNSMVDLPIFFRKLPIFLGNVQIVLGNFHFF